LKIAILGGGVTGLTTSHLLARKGHDTTVFEKDDVPGGLCRSRVVKGFTFDRAGGHIIFSKDGEVMEFIRSLLGEQNMVRSDRLTKIFYRGHYVKYPFENGLGELPAEDRFDCVKGYIEAYYERRNGSEPPPNFRDWVLWRFGEGIARCFMFPYNQKIWKVDLGDLSSSWVAGRVPDAPIDDVLRSAVGISTEGYKHQAVFWYPITGGFQTITDRLAERIGASLRLETPVETIVRRPNGFEVNGEPFDSVINTMPLQECYRRFEGCDPEAARAAESLRFRGLASFMIGLGTPETTRYSWIYLPHEENGPANRITHLANYSPRNAPEGKSSILAEVTYEGDPRVDEAMAWNLVERMHDSGILDKGKVEVLEWSLNPYAYILFTHDFHENRDAAIRGLEEAGMHTVGRFGRYEYHNSDQCIRQAMDLVARF
jgi:protoporphyrinogen oxidase